MVLVSRSRIYLTIDNCLLLSAPYRRLVVRMSEPYIVSIGVNAMSVPNEACSSRSMHVCLFCPGFVRACARFTGMPVWLTRMRLPFASSIALCVLEGPSYSA
jgi:hypothetical protein